MGFFNKVLTVIQDWFQKLTAEQKKRLALICTGVFAVLLTLSVLLSVINPGERPLPGGPERLMIISPIPAGDLFLPDEPDYVPGVLLGRDRRDRWTEEDASLFWQDPLRYGEEKWREDIEAAIDDLLEQVP